MGTRYVGVVVVAAVTWLGLAPSTPAQTPQGDSVTGTLFDQIETGTSVFGMDAHSGASGENPSGTADWHVGGGNGRSWTVSITCLSVTGNMAILGFTGTTRFLGMETPVAGL